MELKVHMHDNFCSGFCLNQNYIKMGVCFNFSLFVLRIVPCIKDSAEQNMGSVILRWIRTRGMSFCVVSEQEEYYSALDKSHSTWDHNKGSVILRCIRVILRGIRTRRVSLYAGSAHKENVIPCLLLSVLLDVMIRFER